MENHKPNPVAVAEIKACMAAPMPNLPSYISRSPVNGITKRLPAQWKAEPGNGINYQLLHKG
jgi:hypothetical protein